MKSYFHSISLIVFWACSNPNFYHVNSEQKDNTPLTDDEKYERYYDSVYPSLLIYGGLPDPKDRQRQIVDEWYKFRFIIMSTKCTNPALNSAYKHNLKTDHVMTERIGYNWYQKFENTVDSLYSIDTLAENTAYKDPRIQKWLKRHNDENIPRQSYQNLEYLSYPTILDHVKMVMFSGIITTPYSARNFNLLRATVDINKMKVINIDSVAFSYW